MNVVSNLWSVSLCVMAEPDGDCGQRPGSLLHHAPQQNTRQAAEELLGHDAETEGVFTHCRLSIACNTHTHTFTGHLWILRGDWCEISPWDVIRSSSNDTREKRFNTLCVDFPTPDYP